MITTYERETVMGIVTQRVNEISRIAREGRRTHDGDLRKLVVIRELGGTWVLYPHGVHKFGVNLGK